MEAITEKCSSCGREIEGSEGRRMTFVVSRESPRVTTGGVFCSDECVQPAVFALRLGLYGLVVGC